MVRHLGLVSETSKATAAELAAVAAAVQKQLVRDFTPIWNVEATIHAFPSLAHMPSDYVPILVVDKISGSGAGVMGVHRGPHNQPYALVEHRARWSVQVSHEVLELLIDPTLDRVVAGPSLKPGQTRVNYLVEVCDPCQSDAYEVNGVYVCDFCTPEYFAPVATKGLRYNFMGTLRGPRDIRPGGYLSWLDVEADQWWFGFPYEGKMLFQQAGTPTAALSLREYVDRESERLLPKSSRKARAVVNPGVLRAAAARAKALRAGIASSAAAVPAPDRITPRRRRDRHRSIGRTSI